MSKYTETIELEEIPMQTLARHTAERIDEEIHMAITKAIRIKVDKDTIIKALQITDRLEQADAVTKEEMREKNCRQCNRHDLCRERKRSMWCTDGIIFERGYRQALADVRGDE